MPLTVNEEKASFRLAGPDFEPEAGNVYWKNAGPSERKKYFDEVGRLAITRKRRDLEKGLDANGDKLKKVLPKSRPDGADGPPLSPHRVKSRFQRYVRVSASIDGVVIYWGYGWRKVVAGHRSGRACGVVRDVVGLSKAAQRWVRDNARAWWKARYNFHTPKKLGPDGVAKLMTPKVPLKPEKPPKPLPAVAITAALMPTAKPGPKVAVKPKAKVKPAPQPKPAPAPKPVAPAREFTTLGEDVSGELRVKLVADAKRDWKGWKDSVTEDERDALDSYKGGGFEGINGALRRGGTHPNVKLIDAALERGKLKEDLFLYRGIKSAAAAGLDVASAANVGKVAPDKGYLSFSMNWQTSYEDFAEIGGALFRVRVPAGTPAGYLDDFGPGFREYEILAGRGHQLRITGLARDDGVVPVYDAVLEPMAEETRGRP
jgi:hypothetical protein